MTRVSLVVILIEMNLQLLIRSLLLTAAVMVETQEVTYTGVLWKAANVRDSIKETPVEEFTTERELACAAEAQRRPWCTLYCYTGNLCSLYGVTFPPSVYPAVVNCKTISPFPLACSPPFTPFLMVEDLGCLYVPPAPSNWDAARAHCLSYGADLVVVSTDEQFVALRDYFISANIQSKKWVGIIDRKWLDGRLMEMWDAGEPNGAVDGTQCGLLQDVTLLDDTFCTREFQYICQA
ncbi:uncharacterized protein LOC119594492 [Penaeus monodon]|uniref:uncharacterized protein LOC119594492 n=1 Tax=Penaeus monodon TaxID=6687 RepID=UPI0018A7C6F8|nr:uncharacterized protein LOC119594492 [Penaeus monodon]